MLWVSSMWVLAGCFSFICHKGGTRFSTLKINGQVRDDFRTCGSHAKLNSKQLICLHHVPQVSSHCRQQNVGQVWKLSDGKSEWSYQGMQSSYM